MAQIGLFAVAVVIVSANAEWREVKRHGEWGGAAATGCTPFGEYYERELAAAGAAERRRVILMQGGWGKVDAAASAQYAVDHWHPDAMLNLGTCGGMAGAIGRGEVILADRTVIYDIVERMGDAEEAIRDYTTAIDLAWLPAKLPIAVRRGGTLVSADRDLDPNDIAALWKRYGAVAADWESGAIARVAARNGVRRVLILRGVSDLVGAASGGEAYGKPEVFARGTAAVMGRLLGSLREWIAVATATAGGGKAK